MLIGQLMNQHDQPSTLDSSFDNEFFSIFKNSSHDSKERRLGMDYGLAEQRKLRIHHSCDTPNVRLLSGPIRSLERSAFVSNAILWQIVQQYHEYSRLSQVQAAVRGSQLLLFFVSLIRFSRICQQCQHSVDISNSDR
jgi:hypothetical protein